AAAGEKIVAVDNVTEVPGAGLIWQGRDGEHRLGNRVFLGVPESASGEPDTGGPEIWYGRPGWDPVCFQFDDAPRPDAARVIGAFKKAGLDVRLLSGDREPVVAAMAGRLGIEEWAGRVTPNDKLRYMEDLRAAGRHPAMVGDGLNDAPALAAALVSLSPSSGADISRNAADIVFQSNRLGGVWESYLVAIRSEALVRQNFAMAFLYNLITVPLAVCGFVTPLIAAVAMSSSSLVVILNALRLGWTGSGRSDRVPSVKSGIATTDGVTGKGLK
ncbi:MAG: HAD-IC family P-type ATPase, partial [Alphaproteobacteria bacterium]|nr:HAD-IC family P-type ATPase [Alphaproteobacteria bacterium]